MTRLRRGIMNGLISGLVLGLFFKLIEQFTKVKVYTLLLNVDYIPVLKLLIFPEWVEFFFHLIISVIIAVILLIISDRYRWEVEQVMFRSVLLSFIIGVLLYPTTALSTRTPAITSIEAIIYWLLGHVIYGCVLGFLMTRNQTIKKKPVTTFK